MVIASALLWRRSARHELDCATAVRSVASGMAAVVCQREYQQTRALATGIRLANSLRINGEFTSASALANDLLATDVRGDALQVLARIAIEQGRDAAALTLLDEARRWHRERGDRSAAAVDFQVMAEIHTEQHHYAESLQLIDDCITEAGSVADARIEGLCHLTAGRALVNLGYFDAAHRELDHAKSLLTEDRDLAIVWLWIGNLEQESVRDPLGRANDEQAVAAFQRSLVLAIRGQRTSKLVNIHMNLAYSLAELGRFDEATRHMEEVGVLDRRGEYASQRTQLAARIAYRAGNHTLAFSLNERAYRSADDLDEQIEICVIQARISLARNDLSAAALWGRRGVKLAEDIRTSQSRSELRPWALATRREPYEVLFTALARDGRIDDAIAVFDQWQGRTLLDEMARSVAGLSSHLTEIAAKLRNLTRQIPAMVQTPVQASESRAAIQVLARIDLVALLVADGTLWRITATQGRRDLDEIGPMTEVRELLEQFESTPTDPGLASTAGAQIVPPGMARNTREPIYLVLDAPLDGLPFVALRQGGRPVIAWRPVQRLPRLPVAINCDPLPDSGTALVLADAAGDLPDARREASRVAAIFGTTPHVESEATSIALFAARTAVLHVAVHAGIDAGGGVLALYDRAVSASEISVAKLAPELVVLSACSTARASDPEVAGSLSIAFLAAGARRVVATLRPIVDGPAREVTSRFYDAGGAHDPVHVLAAVQAELAAGNNTDWPNFAVFGSDVCPGQK